MHKLLPKLREQRARHANDEKGFTLIELLVVVVILGVLIAIAIPLYLNYRKGANDSATQSDLRNAISVLEVCNSDNAGYPAAVVLTSSPATPCTNQKINLSAGTFMTYSSPTGNASYVLQADNTSGNTAKWFCYDSAVGGAVKSGAKPAAVTSCA